MKKVFMIVGGIILVIIVIAAVSGSGSETTTENKGEQSVAKSNGEVEVVAAEPMQITAQELADDFDNNKVAAEAEWKDKFVEFSAEISNITDSGLSFGNVASEQISFTQISCRVKDKQQLLPLSKSQTVTVRGTIGGQSIGVIDVKNCEVVS